MGQYLALRTGVAEVPEPAVRALHARTDGLPLFLAGVVDELLARGGPGANLGPDAAGISPPSPTEARPFPHDFDRRAA